MPVRRRSHDPIVVGALLAGVLGGCAEWPRWSHLPDESDAIEATDDPRDLVDRDWTVDLSGDDAPDASAGVAPIALDTENGLIFEGGLLGLGWNDLADPLEVVAPGCDDVGAARHPEVIPGEWLGDVDVVVVTAPDGGHLCAELAVVDASLDGLTPSSVDEIGWDLLLARLDPCGVPDSFAEGPDGPLGWGRGGARGGWSAPLEPGVPYAVTLAGYWPTAPEGGVVTRLALSLVTPADGDDALCPHAPLETP